MGWGGLPQVFDPKNEQWVAEYREVQGLLSPDDYTAARRSTQDAHYTSETVIRGIYQGLSRLGLGSGDPLRILEPSAGIGNFIGLCPENFNASFMAVELDPTTSAIARYLYPEAKHLNTGFQNSLLRSGGIDAVVGNPPFGNQSLYDPDFPELRKFSVHNYFLAKSIGLLREGGVAAFVVSRYFMDSADPTVREHISRYADFLGAVRLPENAFRQNALTDVTTDIVFFQKNSAEKLSSKDWLNTATIEVDDLKNGGRRQATVNSYFVEHPRQVIGTLAFSGGMFEGALNCLPDPAHADLGWEITDRLNVLPADCFVPQEENPLNTEVRARNAEFIRSPYFQSLKMGALCVEPQIRKIVFKTAAAFGEGDYDPLPVKNETARLRLTGMIQIRDTLRELLNEEKSDGDESRMTNLRHRLNSQYDVFVRKYGHLNSHTNRGLMRSDPEHSLLESLEADYDKGLSPDTARKHGGTARPASAKKAAIFRQRVLKPAQVVEQAETIKDALLIALRESGKADFSRMEQLLRRPADSIQTELRDQGQIFLNPANEEWEIRDKYLTGNVRAKLYQAREAAQNDARFAPNVEALAAAMPPEIEAMDIGIKFGSSWVPADVFSDFIEHLHSGKGRQVVRYLPTLGRWEATVSIWDASLATSVWGIPEYSAGKIVEALLTNKSIKVQKPSGQKDERGDDIMVIDQELTAAAMQKADEIKQAFLDWVWTDDERRDMLTKLYNERFNTHVPPHYDGSHLELVGASEAVKLRPHQKDAVWRGIQEGTALFDHVVGAGKTMVCVATVMESRRMGFLSKPMIVVPNHLLHQWRDEFYKLYPGANILVADKTDFTKQNRERLFGRIATGDWDAVIVAHSSFRKIDMPRDVQEEILREQIDAVIEAIEASKAAEGGRATIKQLEKQREKMEARYEALLAGTGKKDQAVDFADLGVDALFMDESHEFKNLAFQTTMNVSGLGNITGSAKALDLFIKCRYLQRKHEGRGVYFMTGTPISNTIAEVYTLQRYIQYDELKNKEIEHFDAWASTFGQITNSWELDATGVNYKLKSRFAKFQNVPELLSMYRTFADVVTKNDLDEQAKQAGERPLTPPVAGGKPFNDVVERSADQAEYMQKIIHRMENLPFDPRIDNPLKVTNDARKAGLDYRLIDPDADDHPGSKINAAVERIHEIWRDTAADKGTQLVFCDLSTPKGGKAPASAPAAPLDLESEALIDVDGTLIREPPEQEDMAEDDDTDDALAGVVNMDEVIAMSPGKYSVYDDMKQKLMAKGIPADEIAFIHDANTDIRKAKLFADMNAGRVRILLGSTAKMGAGMNVQKRLVAAHHLDAPWRPSDLEQRNGRIIRQGNIFYERDPDNFTVSIYNYATKQTYDARMWQTIEYKSAAIEQFRKGDLLQRVIDDVASEAANAAEMKAAASGNPLILMQVQLAADLRKLEALYSQHQRGQHRLRDRLTWLNSTESRLAKEESLFAENIRRRDSNTRTITEKGKEKILVELRADGKVFAAKDGEKIKDRLLDGVKEVTRDSSAKVLFGSYRGFEVYVERAAKRLSGKDGFQLALRGAEKQEFRPGNLFYDFDEKFSLAGLFQRIDNFLAKGLDEAVEAQRENARQESAELETVNAALGKEFPQKDDLTLARENHGAVIRELQRMQDDANYVSTWEPKTSLAEETPAMAESAEQTRKSNDITTDSVQPKKEQYHTLKFGEGEGRTEYTASNQHNGYTLDGHVLRRTYFSSLVGSLGQSLYEDDQWYSTATAPRGVKLKQFETQEAALQVARSDAAQRGLQETPAVGVAYHERLAKAGFHVTGTDFHGKNEHELTMDAGDGGTFEMRVFQAAGDQIGLRVQYEKYNLIDDSRTVNTQFSTLDEALECVDGYQNVAERQSCPQTPETAPAEGVRGIVFSRPRMR
ncbi:SNF2-related protein [Desulfovibrio sp.]|uniref:DEAD/DEAH box helicase family protein n=1 Tax=Desulfovibrio sp. TaxID=885 RepID=UPI0025C0A9C5|nr:SNF2-related protein [Desulfovibrio sp.]